LRVVTKAFLRYLKRRRSLSLLQLLGIACGVAAAVGMALSAQSSLASFSKAVDFLKGKSTHSLERPAGPLSEDILLDLAQDPALAAFSPVIDRRIRLGNGETTRLLGIDPFLDRPLRPALTRTRPGEGSNAVEGLISFLTDEQAVLIDEPLAEQLNIKAGEFLESSRGRLKVVGIFPNASSEPLLLMDIAHAQRLLDLPGKVDRVDLILVDDAGFRSRWSEGFRIQSGRQRQETLGDMLQAFRLNLQALSLLALFVGVFLVYNTAMFAVVSRSRDAGILRSLGASRREILLAFSSEIFLLGSLGGALGGLFGFLLSRFLTQLVAGTISNLYFFLRPAPQEWSWWILGVSVLLGWGASVFGGVFPLSELVRVDPIQALRGRTALPGVKKLAGKAALGGLGILGIGLLLLLASSLHVYFGFASSFALLLGASLFMGWALLLLGPVIKGFLSALGGLAGKVAAGNIRQNLGRTSVAVAAFMVALSMSIGLSSMIGSFRQTLIWWMGTQLQADLFIGRIGEREVPESFYEEVRSLPGIGGLDLYRNVQVLHQGTPIFVASVEAATLQKYARFGWLRGGDENWEPVKKGAAIVSESFQRRFGVKEGGQVVLEGRRGPAPVTIAAVFYDYTSEHGVIMMDRSTYLRLFEDRTINTLGVFVDSGNPERQEILTKVARMARDRGLPVYSRDQLWESILSVFDSTFAVTRSMRLLAIIVAFFGIAGALMTLFIERQKEFGIYRALGFSTRQVAGMTLLEGLGMGLVSFLASVGVGTALAWILIRVINRESFNWTIFYYPSWEPYAAAAVTAVLASAGAALYPIWKVYRKYPQMQIREE
jgi:putative ABC transport system permease protein